MRVLLVEDDALLGDAVVVGLGQAGFAVDWVRDGASGDTAMTTNEYAAVVLDLGLPRLSGLDLLRKQRIAGRMVPVLILTARDAVDDRIRGLDSGADDYLVKPVDLHELAARLRALIRRAQGRSAPLLRVGTLTLDPAAHCVTFLNKPIELSAREFALLHEFMLSAGQVLSRDQLEQRLYAWGEEVESNAVEVYVHHLRRKLSSDLIRTIRGVGYLLPRPPSD